MNGEPNVKRGSHKNIQFIHRCACTHTNTHAHKLGQSRWGPDSLVGLKGRRVPEGNLFVSAPAPRTEGQLVG